ncbi:IPTL-CTERM sorting domain-containing protein, partial [Pseudomonas sp.]|uniref:IPTL-CTERM sorting domain-containing protein n=1 Tax=Pseudomonas sp. TaxID=306 RepID=UPI0026057684
TWFAHGSVSGDTVTYTVTDNGIGDSNLTPGVIADPFAPMLLAAPVAVQPIPTLSQWAMVLLTMLLAALGLRAQRRKAQV